MKIRKRIAVGLICFSMLSIVGCTADSSKSQEASVNKTTTTSQENVQTKDEEKINISDFPLNEVIQTKYPESEIIFREISYNPINKGLYLKFDFKNMGSEPIEGRDVIHNSVFQNGIEIPNNDGLSIAGADPIKDNDDTCVSCNKNATTKVQQGYEMKDCEVKFPLEPVDSNQIEVDFNAIPYKVVMAIQ